LYKEDDLEVIVQNIQYYLINAVHKRCENTERPIACLLSGGLDSSLITALVQEFHNDNGMPPVETYSIGLAGSEDLRYAKIVADHLGTKHTEIVLTEKDFVDAIPDVIRSIESYDTTTVRASIGNWLLGEYIAKHSKAKVIFNGDGSDELMGGYLYMNACPDSIEYDRESRRLLRDIHAFDVLRSDKSISSHGLEPRTPFLDRSWVQFYLSIHPDIRNHRFQNQCEKFLVRFAFFPFPAFLISSSCDFDNFEINIFCCRCTNCVRNFTNNAISCS
jgi:asparagine synthase (glutamine-hydrolysing)